MSQVIIYVIVILSSFQNTVINFVKENLQPIQ